MANRSRAIPPQVCNQSAPVSSSMVLALDVHSELSECTDSRMPTASTRREDMASAGEAKGDLQNTDKPMLRGSAV
jgi:hypothetical protein